MIPSIRLTAWLAGALVVLAAISPLQAAGTGETLGYHEIQVDDQGYIVPWYSDNLGVAYSHDIGLVWNWWKNLETCSNGLKYYTQHQVWRPEHDSRGLGGDQVAMALSSWSLLYAYSGDATVVDNMKYLADTYLARSLSSPSAIWANLPFPYNTDYHSGDFDGDMVAGPGVLQPDKAGSFGAELVTLYEMTGTTTYLDAAQGIADTLARRVATGNGQDSPWPYRVNATTGAVFDSYTSNWTGALRLFDELIHLGRGDVAAYDTARKTVRTWLRTWPEQTNVWGPFFEDVSGWSDTETNADTLAWYILEHPLWSPAWLAEARRILDWSYDTFANFGWSRYGATAIEEQTAYRVPGNSHTARHWSVELLYAEKSGDLSRKTEAIRGLNWATYMVDVDGKNRYPQSDIWLTDGYGDYVRHYLRAMAAAPELAPAAENHLLRSTSVIGAMTYACNRVDYTTFDTASRETLRLGFYPQFVTAGGVPLPRLASPADLEHSEGYVFGAESDIRGLLRLRHDHDGHVAIWSRTGGPGEVALSLKFTSRTTLTWLASPGVVAYDVYRGTFGSGSWSFNHSCFRTRLVDPTTDDPDSPAVHAGLYYLVSGANACGEGTLGKTSSGAERPISVACP